MSNDLHEHPRILPLTPDEDRRLDTLLRAGGGQTILRLIEDGLDQAKLVHPAGAVQLAGTGSIVYRPPVAFGIGVPQRVLLDLLRADASDTERILARTLISMAVATIRPGLAEHLARLATGLATTRATTDGSPPAGNPPPESRILVPGRD